MSDKRYGQARMLKQNITVSLLVTLALAALLPTGRGSLAGSPLEASGVIQVEEIRVASEFQGYVLQVAVQAGNGVAEGQVLLVLQSNAAQASIQQAQAGVQTAEAELQRVKAQPRAEEVAIKRAQLAMAQAERDGAYAVWQAALHTLEEPQQLQEQVLKAEAQVALAAQNVQLAEADAARARSEADQAAWSSTERQGLEFEAKAAQEALAGARADERAAQIALQHLQGMRQRPIALKAKANAAQGKHRVAAAAVQVAQAVFDDFQAGATPQEVAVAEANLVLAQAQLRLVQTQSDRLTIRAPLKGTVVGRMVNVGETALPGVTLLTLADLSGVSLTVYVPENRLGALRLGQAVDVTVDTFPKRRFEGQVVHIADLPQYTPRNVATKDERVNTVYGVKIRVPNPEGLLKPGMAADAVFRP